MQIWDISTRLYHWLQALLFVLLVVTGNTGDGPHVDLGIALMVLVVWRILWGFWGSQTNRFSHFVRSPWNTLRYLFGKLTVGVGHNPAGGWMIVVLLLVLLAQCVSGFAMAGFMDNLPYADVWLTDGLFEVLENVHVYGVTLLQVLVGTHVLAIVIYKLRGTPLLQAMVTGVQHGVDDQPAPYFVSQWRAVWLLVIVASGTVAITFL